MPAYKDKKTGKWFYQINYKDINGVYKSLRKRGFNTKKEAKDAEYLKSIEMDRSPVSSTIAFKKLYYLYFEYARTKVKYSSYYSKKNLADIHILPLFERHNDVNKITTNDIIKWQSEMLKKNLSHAYLSKIYSNLSSIFKHGVKYYSVKVNPCPLVGDFKRPDEIIEELNYWTYQEFKQFISYVDHLTYYTFFYLLYYTGMRKGEALALSWKDLDFNKHEISVSKNVSEKSTEGGWKITSPKTKFSNRRILISKSLEENLRRYYEWCEVHAGFTDQDFVFGVSRPLPTTTVSRKFDEYIKASGVKKIKIHDIRHSHASLLINQGASILIVSQRLGHKDVKETLNTYGHMFPNAQKEVVDLLDNL